MSYLFKEINQAKAQEIQFRLGHKTLIRKNDEWMKFGEADLSLSEWEDLKDLCLQNTEKVTLETKGFISGFYQSDFESWNFSFSDWKDCMKAYFSLNKATGLNSHLTFTPYWDSLKESSGVHIIAGQKKSGRSSFIKEILGGIWKNSPELIGVYGSIRLFDQEESDLIVSLGQESIGWEYTHTLYEGMNTFVVDLNDLQQIEKWVRFSEEGRKVIITLSASSMKNVIAQLLSYKEKNGPLWFRLSEQLKTIVFQKSFDQQIVQEVVVLKDSEQSELSVLDNMNDLKKWMKTIEHYQSLNQSILQALVRRRIDVKTAFALTADPVALDENLKKMGL